VGGGGGGGEQVASSERKGEKRIPRNFVAP